MVVARAVKLEDVIVEWKIYSTAANLDVLKVVQKAEQLAGCKVGWKLGKEEGCEDGCIVGRLDGWLLDCILG